MKRCSKCHESKTIDLFGLDRRTRDGRRYWCKDCDHARMRQYAARVGDSRTAKARERRRANPDKSRQYKKDYYIKNRARIRGRMLVRGAWRRAQKGGLPFDLDAHVADIQQRIDDGKCEMSGIPFRLDGGARTFDVPSIDRIEPAKGYVYSNIRIVCHALNCALGHWGEATLLQVLESWQQKRKLES